MYITYVFASSTITHAMSNQSFAVAATKKSANWTRAGVHREERRKERERRGESREQRGRGRERKKTEQKKKPKRRTANSGVQETYVAALHAS